MNVLDTSAVIRIIPEMIHQKIQAIGFIDQKSVAITATTSLELDKVVKEKQLYMKMMQQYGLAGSVWRLILTFKEYAISRLPRLVKLVNNKIIQNLNKYLRERDAKIYSEAISVAESVNGTTFVACDKHYRKQEVTHIGCVHKLKTIYVNPREEVKTVMSSSNLPSQ